MIEEFNQDFLDNIDNILQQIEGARNQIQEIQRRMQNDVINAFNQLNHSFRNRLGNIQNLLNQNNIINNFNNIANRLNSLLNFSRFEPSYTTEFMGVATDYINNDFYRGILESRNQIHYMMKEISTFASDIRRYTLTRFNQFFNNFMRDITYPDARRFYTNAFNDIFRRIQSYENVDVFLDDFLNNRITQGLDIFSDILFDNFLNETNITGGIRNLSGISQGLNRSFQEVNQLIRIEAGRQFMNLNQGLQTAQHTFTTYAERIRQPFLRGIDIPGGAFSPELFGIDYRNINLAQNENIERLGRYINITQNISQFLNPDLTTPTEAINNLRENLVSRVRGRLLEINSSIMRIAQQYNIQDIDFQSVETELNRGNIRNAINNLNRNIYGMIQRFDIPETQRNILGEYFTQLNTLGRNFDLSEKVFDNNLSFRERLQFSMKELGGVFHNLGSMTSQMYLFTGIFGLTMPLYYQLSSLPMIASQLSTQPFINTGLNLFGLQNFLNIFTSFPQMIPSLMVNLQNTITSMSSLFGSQQIGRKAVETALEISKTEPIQFQEALDTILTGAIYPELRYKILRPDIQRSIFNTAQMLATLVPEQGIEGALFAIRELFGGQYRSLQTRFNIDIDLISQYAGVTREQLRSASPEKILQYLEKSLVNLMGGNEFLLARGFTFGVQLNNIIDTLTQAIILPLNQNSQQIAKIYEKMSDEQIRRLFPYLYEKLGENPEEVRKFLSFNASSPLGLLSAMTSSLNTVLEEVFDKIGLGDIISKTLTKYAERFIGLTNEVLGELETVDPTSKRDAIRKYVKGVGNIARDIVNEVVDALNDTGMVDIISGLSTQIATKLFQPVMNEMVKVAGSEMLKAPVTLAGAVGGIITSGIENIFTAITTLGKEGDISKSLTDIINFAGGIIGNIGIMRYGFGGDIRALTWGFGAPFVASGLTGMIENGIDFTDIVNLGIGGGLLYAGKNWQSIRNNWRYIQEVATILSRYILVSGFGAGIGLIALGGANKDDLLGEISTVIGMNLKGDLLDKILTVIGMGLLGRGIGVRNDVNRPLFSTILGVGLGGLWAGGEAIYEGITGRKTPSWIDDMIRGGIIGLGIGSLGVGSIFGPGGAAIAAVIGAGLGLGYHFLKNRAGGIQDIPEIDFSKLHDYLIPEREKEFMSKVHATATILPERLKTKFIADAKSRFSSTLETFYKSFEEFLEISQENLINIISEEHKRTSGGIGLLNKQKKQIVDILNANLSRIQSGMKNEEVDKIIDETIKSINKISNITPTTIQSVRDLFYNVRSRRETESVLTSQVEQQLLNNLGIDIGELISKKALNLIMPQPPIKPHLEKLTPLERVSALFKYAEELYSYEAFKRDFELDKIDLPIYGENKFLTPKDIPIYKSAFSGALGYAGKVFSLLETEFNMFGRISPEVDEIVNKIKQSPLLTEYMIKGGAGFISSLHDYAVLTGDKELYYRIADKIPEVYDTILKRYSAYEDMFMKPPIGEQIASQISSINAGIVQITTSTVNING